MIKVLNAYQWDRREDPAGHDDGRQCLPALIKGPILEGISDENRVRLGG